jgi:hypothetical protein
MMQEAKTKPTAAQSGPTQRTPTQHPFTELVLKFTFGKEEWKKFEAAYEAAKGDWSKRPPEYKFLNEEQWAALGLHDGHLINLQIEDEYYSPKKPGPGDDLIGGLLLLKDWTAHQ